LGYQSLLLNTTGIDNTAFGANAGDKISSGSKNIFVGTFAGSKIASASLANTSGTNSVLIGYDVRPAADSQTNQIVISGYNGTSGTVGLGSNTTLIGASTTTDTRIMGALDLPDATASTSSTSGALKVAGGAGIAGALNVGTTATITGATSLSSTLGVTGNVAVNTDKFKITASNGNTEIAGTISIAGGSPGAGKVLTSTDTSGIASWVTPSGVPYTGATGAVNLGSYDLTVNGLTIGEGGGGIAKNTVLGSGAMSATATGAENTAVGYDALKANTSGANNVAVGNIAATSLTTGTGNVALGSQALRYATTGASNNAIGYGALNSVTTASSNIGIGPDSGSRLTTGANNITIGNRRYNSKSTTHYGGSIYT
jgi:hypothetical protein